MKNPGKFGLDLVFEMSSDPFQLEEEKSWITYPGIIINYMPVHSTKVSLFAGKRRGGPACNSGVCYDVLDFEGIELRISTTFQFLNYEKHIEKHSFYKPDFCLHRM